MIAINFPLPGATPCDIISPVNLEMVTRKLRTNAILLLAFGLLLTCLTAAAQNGPGSAPQPAFGSAGLQRHKIRVSDPAVASQIMAQGGRLIANYGSYQLLEAAQVSPALAAGAQAEIRDDYNEILLNAARLDTTKAEVKALRKAAGSFGGKRMHLVHFAGPILPEWRQSLEAAGVQIVAYVPQNAYLLYGDASSLAKIQALAATARHIQWDGPYLDDYKIHPRARPMDRKGNPRQVGTDLFAVQLVADPAANTNTLQLLERLKLEPFKQQHSVLHYVNLVVRLSPKDLQAIAAQPDVVSIQPYFPRKKFCERQDQIIAGNLSGNVPSGPGYLAWLASKGFTQAQFSASGFTVDVSDSGIDNGTTSPNHLGLHLGGDLTNASRVTYNRLEGWPNPESTLVGCDGHGTINAHIIGGYNDLSGFPHTDAFGYHYGLGVCPFVNVGSSVIFDPVVFTDPNYNNLQSEAYQSGARVSNNSWGADTAGDYDIDAQHYDALVRDAQPPASTYPAAGNQEMVIVFAAGNAGPGAETVGSPATAKNVISVGAGEDVQAFGGEDGSHITDDEADSANDIIFFSSRGPCTDGRHKPDIAAPGTHVSGGVAQASNPGPNGSAISCFNGEGVSGGVSDIFFPASQQFYTASSGTSHAAPCVAGACALLRQYFINTRTNPPSPAMTKAYLMNSARYMTGVGARDILWSDNQGMGELNLGTAFDNTPRFLRDELSGDLFTASGQSRTFTGFISDSSKPLRVTVAWTDAPGSTVGSAYNNDLDLTVTAGGNTYKGNVFGGAYSVTGGAADSKNNVESVFLPAGVSGSFTVKVTAANLNSDGVPNNAYPLDQDFALVIYNAAVTIAPVISGAGSTLTAETYSPANGVIDPGETVTVSFALQNTGSANTTNLVATLRPNTGILWPSGPQTYGALPAGGAVVSRSFTFTANGACGGAIAATLLLQDGPANLGSVTFTFALGQPFPGISFTENFDAVATPNLPAGWTTSTIATGTTWTTSAAVSDSASNSAFALEVDTSGVGELLSPVIPIGSSSAQLSFRHSYDTEIDPNLWLGYDGGVLEIKIGNDPFTDILAAGGTFLIGGYTRALDSTGYNPLGSRQAWCGNSGGFITTTVRLPAAAAGQNAQLKWRFATDRGNFYGGSGWYIDTLSINDVSYTCFDPGPTPPAIIAQPVNQTVVVGTDAAFQVSPTGSLPLAFQWFFNGASLPGATANPLTLTNAQVSQRGGYSVVITNLSGSVTSAVATLAVLVPPNITRVNPTTTNTAISFNSLASQSYTLEYKNALTDPQWQPISATLPGTGGVLSLIDTNAPVPTRFYRIRCN